MSDETRELIQCGETIMDDIECTRTIPEHETHTAYVTIDGQLTHVSWFACNPIGEPTASTETDNE